VFDERICFGVCRKYGNWVYSNFDPIHKGHVRMFEEAKKLGDHLVVVVNNDHWIKSKKIHGFMSAQDRAEVISAFRHVDEVIISSHKKNVKGAKNMGVTKELIHVRPHIFANGGDRDEKNANDPESSLYWDIQICKKLGIKQIYNVGRGGKISSSSELLYSYLNKKRNNVTG
jgi:D-beta-D-heptose 7-phosphate kinase/D-beta-D-heptose 1-phosphate adenosyltransferase